ncbi:MAG: lysoplasmalogenase [Actinomycetota bacterium]
MHRFRGGILVILVPAIIASAILSAILDGSRPGLSRVFKMAASTAVIALVFVLSPERSAYLVLVIAALAASWVGDLALSYDGRVPFVIGLVAFAGAHVAYIAAFLARSALDTVMLLVAGAAMVVFAAVVIRWLSPHRPAELKIPIIVYVVIISAMVATAFATHATVPDIRIPLAAVTFAASDLFVARQRFVTPARVNRVVGLPLYFIAQTIFATTP